MNILKTLQDSRKKVSESTDNLAFNNYISITEMIEYLDSVGGELDFANNGVNYELMLRRYPTRTNITCDGSLDPGDSYEYIYLRVSEEFMEALRQDNVEEAIDIMYRDQKARGRRNGRAHFAEVVTDFIKLSVERCPN